ALSVAFASAPLSVALASRVSAPTKSYPLSLTTLFRSHLRGNPMLAEWAVSLMESLGGVGAAVVVGLDNLFPPIPSELVLPQFAQIGRAHVCTPVTSGPRMPSSA